LLGSPKKAKSDECTHVGCGRCVADQGRRSYLSVVGRLSQIGQFGRRSMRNRSHALKHFLRDTATLPEAQHPKSLAIHTIAGRLPHLWGTRRHSRRPTLNCWATLVPTSIKKPEDCSASSSNPMATSRGFFANADLGVVLSVNHACSFFHWNRSGFRICLSKLATESVFSGGN